jgi:hypothetical protein
MNLTLTKIVYKAFRGLGHPKPYVFEPGGKNASIFGRNGAMKSTHADAYFWLIDGRDTSGDAKFDLKTEDAEGIKLHNLEHSAEAHFDLDGKKIVLQKIFKEVWQAARGSATKELTSHTTDHYINGVSKTEGEYNRFLDSICPRDRWRMLADPYHYQRLKSLDLRTLLVDAFGDVSDDDVFSGREELSPLNDILQAEGRTMDDHKKTLKSQRPKTNAELGGIPGLIKENQRALEFEHGDIVDMAALRGELQALQTRKTEVASGGEIARKRVEVTNLKAERAALTNAQSAEGFTAYRKACEAVQAVEVEMGKTRTDIETLERKLAADQAALTDVETNQEKLRSKYRTIAATEWPASLAICPGCKRELPAERVETLRAEFNNQRAEELAATVKLGKAAGDMADTLKEKIHAKTAELATARDLLASMTGEKARLGAVADSLKPGEAPETVEQDALNSRIRDMEAEIVSMGVDVEASTVDIEAEIIAKNREIQAGEEAAAAAKERERASTRIAELEAQERALAKERERIDHELFLIDQFERARCDMLTEKIDSHFEFARFRLFEPNITNDGIALICEPKYLGLPPSQGQSVEIGLDMCRTLAKAWGISVPIWIDDVALFTGDVPTEAQQIRLVASADDEKLRVEVAS